MIIIFAIKITLHNKNMSIVYPYKFIIFLLRIISNHSGKYSDRSIKRL